MVSISSKTIEDFIMRHIRSFLIISFFAIALAACSEKVVEKEDDIEVEVVEGVAGNTDTSGLGDDEPPSTSGLDNEPEGTDSELSYSRVIYFEYDSSLLTPENEAIIRGHAQHLVATSGASVILEGHTDERGTREYNLALGEDRAKAVASLMRALGVSGDRIQTISYGEERPISPDSSETAWRLSRRVEILYR